MNPLPQNTWYKFVYKLNSIENMSYIRHVLRYKTSFHWKEIFVKKRKFLRISKSEEKYLRIKI